MEVIWRAQNSILARKWMICAMPGVLFLELMKSEWNRKSYAFFFYSASYLFDQVYGSISVTLFVPH